MQKNKIFKYQIGLVVIGLFTLGITIFLVIQAGVTKQDNDTFERANKTANALNKYLDEIQTIPESLEKAKITYDKETVTYKKVSDESYKFCVTYKADSSSIDGASLVSAVMYGGFDGQMSYSDEDYEYNSLYLADYSRKKGENCYNVRPYVYNNSDTSYSEYDYEAGEQDQSDARYDDLLQDIDACSNGSTPYGDVYDACVERAYDAYYGQSMR